MQNPMIDESGPHFLQLRLRLVVPSIFGLVNKDASHVPSLLRYRTNCTTQLDHCGTLLHSSQSHTKYSLQVQFEELIAKIG